MEQILGSVNLGTVAEKLRVWRSTKKRGKSVPSEIKELGQFEKNSDIIKDC